MNPKEVERKEEMDVECRPNPVPFLKLVAQLLAEKWLEEQTKEREAHRSATDDLT